MMKVALGDIADIVSGATPKSGVDDYWGGNVQWVTPADLSGLTGAYISTTPRTLTDSGLRSCSATVLPPGSVLLSSRAPIGHVAITTAPMATNQGFKSLVPRQERVDAKYLYHWLRANNALLQSLGNGATFKEISKAVVARIEVPLPRLEEQRRIAAILDQADALRAKRRQVLADLDVLVAARFEELFGGGEFPSAPLGELVGTGDRVNYGVVQPGGDVDAGVPVIRVSDLRGGAVDRTRLKRIDPLIESAYARSRIRGNEVLISCVGSIGNVAVVSELDVGSNIARAICRVPIESRTTRLYVAEYLRSRAAQSYFTSELRTVAQATLNVKQLAATRVPLPPIEMQRVFVRSRDLIEKIRANAGRADAETQILFGSLQSRAFRGEL